MAQTPITGSNNFGRSFSPAEGGVYKKVPSNPLLRHKLALAGMVILLLMLLAAILAPFVAFHDPTELNLEDALASPSLEHPFGKDRLGRDIFSRVVYGSRVSILVGLVVVGISCTAGILIGSIAGYCGGLVDELIMRITDVFLAFPGILLAIAIMAILQPGLGNVIFALCIMGWVGYARLVRGQILSVKEREYITAGRSLGAGPLRLMTKHLLPNVMTPLIVEATFGMAGAILAEAGLSFLGLGVQPPQSSWGSMLNEGREMLLQAPHLTAFPGAAIMAVVLGFNFLGDGLRDYLDPRSTSRVSRTLPG